MNLKPLTTRRTESAHTTTNMIHSSGLGTLVEKITGQSNTISMVKRIPIQAGTGSTENQITDLGEAMQYKSWTRGVHFHGSDYHASWTRGVHFHRSDHHM